MYGIVWIGNRPSNRPVVRLDNSTRGKIQVEIVLCTEKRLTQKEVLANSVFEKLIDDLLRHLLSILMEISAQRWSKGTAVY